MQDITAQLQTLLLPVQCVQVVNTLPSLARQVQQYVPLAPPARGSTLLTADQQTLAPALTVHALQVSTKLGARGHQLVPVSHVMQGTTAPLMTQLTPVPHARVGNTPPFQERLIRQHALPAPPAPLVSTRRIVG